jgi:hypothetical protein
VSLLRALPPAAPDPQPMYNADREEHRASHQ